jgi:hypothetical protein
MRNVGAQMGEGSRLQTAVALVAQTYHNASKSAIGGGACRCNGGSSHCSGCKVIPIYRTQSRMKGDDGPAGLRGNPMQDMLLRGRAGADGRVQIIVRNRDGGRPRYDNCYDLQLVDFDLEDENGDGIFEPGDQVIVRRMIIKNAGKMIISVAIDWMLTIFEVACHLLAVRFLAESSRQMFFFHSRKMKV